MGSGERPEGEEAAEGRSSHVRLDFGSAKRGDLHVPPPPLHQSAVSVAILRLSGAQSCACPVVSAPPARPGGAERTVGRALFQYRQGGAPGGSSRDQASPVQVSHGGHALQMTSSPRGTLVVVPSDSILGQKEF